MSRPRVTSCFVPVFCCPSGVCHVYKRCGAGDGIAVVVGAGVGEQCGDNAGVSGDTGNASQAESDAGC